MSELLSAASLLLAVNAMLFSIWFKDIDETLKANQIESNRKKLRNQIKSALWHRSMPLFVLSLILVLIFVWDAVIIVEEAFELFEAESWNALNAYSAVNTAFCMVVAVLGILALYSAQLVRRLAAKLRKLT